MKVADVGESHHLPLRVVPSGLAGLGPPSHYLVGRDAEKNPSVASPRSVSGLTGLGWLSWFLIQHWSSGAETMLRVSLPQ